MDSNNNIEGDSDGLASASAVALNLKLLRNPEDWDIVFVIGPEKERIGARRAILKERSTYFEARFSGRWEDGSNPERKTSEIVLEDEEPSIFRSFLQHIYAYVFSPTSIIPVEAVKLLHLAQYYGVPSLFKPCEEVLAENIFQLDHLLEVFTCARKFGLSDVTSRFGNFMAKYFAQLGNSSSFEKFDEGTLLYLLERDDLQVGESKLFSILVRWADKQIENSTEDPKPGRWDVLKNLLDLVRFTTLTQQDFAKYVAPTRILPAEAERSLFLYFAHPDEILKKALASQMPYSGACRQNVTAYIDFNFLKIKSRPSSGTYALEKCPHVQDILTISGVDYRTPSLWKFEVVSLLLEPPSYSEHLVKNSSEAASRNLPIRVAITFSEAETNVSEPTWRSEEVIVTLESGPMILKLDKPWFIAYNRGRTYRLTTRFLSNVYIVPAAVGHRSRTFKTRSMGAGFPDPLCVPYVLENYVQFSMSGSAGSATYESSGLHLIRSIQGERLKK